MRAARASGDGYAPHPPPLPIRPFRRRVGPAGAASRILREARSTAQVARPARRERRLLLAALGMCLADAAPRVPYSRQTVYYHFRRWRLDGRLHRAHDALRSEVRAREGRARDPSAAAIDSQAVKTSRAGGPERGYDGAKRLAGRKRHILVDTNGLVLAACVHGADLPDRDGGRRLLAEGLGRKLPRLELVWADGAYTGGFREWAEEKLGWRVEVPYHRDRQLWRYGLEEKPRGFRVLPRRWVVERTFAWLSQVRRLSKDYERLPQTAEAMIYWAMSRIMLRRLVRAA